MDVKKAQAKLQAKGYYDGAIDGEFGPKTIGAMMKCINKGWEKHFPDLAKYIWRDCQNIGVTTPLRLCHYLAQAGHETARFTTLKELGGETYFTRYEYRKDLGNTQAGDGAKFKGRGIFQTTGRYNYTELEKVLGVDLSENPSLLGQPDLASKSAAHFWKSRKINELADKDDLKGVTRKINGGQNGLHDREEFTEVLKDLFR